MFSVKATYRNETRKFSFPDSVSFPSYDQLYHQLYRVFPISHNYYLSKLLFSPDASKPSRILIRREVHNADEYDAGIAPFRALAWPGALLKFAIYDETPHKLPSSVIGSERTQQEQLPESGTEVSGNWRNSLCSQQSGMRASTHGDATPQAQQGTVFISPSHIPPPPIIFSSSQAPMEIDDPPAQAPLTMPKLHGPSWSPIRPWTPIMQPPHVEAGKAWQKVGNESHMSGPAFASPRPPLQQQHCCSISQGKADVQALFDAFKQDLDRIVFTTFGSSLSDFQRPTWSQNVPPIIPSPPINPTCMMPPATIIPPPSHCPPHAAMMYGYHQPPPVVAHQPLPAHEPSAAASDWWKWKQYWWCHVCGEDFDGPSYYTCPLCHWKVLCHKCGNDPTMEHMHSQIRGSAHYLIKRTWGEPYYEAPTPPRPATQAICPHSSSSYSPCRCSVPPSAPHSRPYTPSNDGREGNLNKPSGFVYGSISSLLPTRLPRAVDDQETEPLLPLDQDRELANEREHVPVTVPEPVVHRNVACDACNETVVGVRHKCLDCPDYDLCTGCISSGCAERHNPFHEFFDIEEPGRVVVHTVFSGDGEREPARFNADTRTRDREEDAGSRQIEREPVTHNATCDMCDSRIIGERWKCLNCPDFDTCASCFTITPEQHPGHGFVRIHKPDDLLIRDALTAGNRHHATCDVCNRRITGVRYKCMHPACPDFDLCANCEATPIPVHPPLHPLLKIQMPDTMIPRVSRIGQAPWAPQPQIVCLNATTQGISHPGLVQDDTPAAPREVAGTASPTVIEPIHTPAEASYVLSRSTPPEEKHAAGYSPRYLPPVPSSPPAMERLRLDSPSRPSSPVASVTASPPHLEPVLPGHFAAGEEESVIAGHDEDANASGSSATTSLASSRAGFTLPPLILDPNSDSFRELWPRVALELRHLLQDPLAAPPSVDDMPTQISTTSTTTAVDSPHEADSTPAMMDSPLTGEALLTRPLVPSRGSESTERKDITPPVFSINRSLAALLNGPDPSSTVSSSPLAASVSTVDDNAATTETEVDSMNPPVPTLSAAVLSDITVPDGQMFPPGAEFMKCWRIVNCGTIDWPEASEVVFVAGESFRADRAAKIGKVAAGEEVDVWTGELKAPDTTGRFVGYWRLRDGDGNHFGHSIWIDINVVEASRHSDGSSDENSLASSAVIMPQSAPVRSTVPSDVAATEQVSSPTSPVTAPSRPATEDAASDGDSDASSVSLISVPSSSEEDDDALWADSRTHVVVSPRERHRAGMEYVVLYDESSSEEE